MPHATKKHRIRVIVRTLEAHDIEAENAEEADDFWYDFALIEADDDTDNEILDVAEVQP